MSIARPFYLLQIPGIGLRVANTSQHIPQKCDCLSRHKRYYATKTRSTTEGMADLQPKTGKLEGHPFLSSPSADTKSPRPGTQDSKNKIIRDAAAMALRLDPNPGARRRWERRMVIKSIQRRGRLTKTEIIKRTERQITTTSDLWQTSMKKLAPLARQIAGKNLKEAIVQMQFSKKKMSKVILTHLKEAEVRAIAERGMGIGPEIKRKQAAKISKATLRENLKESTTQEPEATPEPEPESGRPKVEIVDEVAEAAEAAAKAKAEADKVKEDADDSSKKDETGEKLKPYKNIILNDGNRHIVWDPSDIYIAQAWVNKGRYGGSQMGRARGRIDRIRKPQTSISVMLKEEATRVREYEDRKARIAKKKVWVQLPNKPIQGQERPYYCW